MKVYLSLLVNLSNHNKPMSNYSLRFVLNFY